MKRITKVNDKQWAELDEVEEPPMTQSEALRWFAGMAFVVFIIVLVCILAGIMQGGSCK